MKRRFFILLMTCIATLYFQCANSQTLVVANVAVNDPHASSGSPTYLNEYDTHFDLVVSTVTRDAIAELFIKNESGNTFSGVFKIDNAVRAVSGWYTEQKSEGGIYKYNSRGLAFYVKLSDKEFQFQQLFIAQYNFDNTSISGDYFYFGNHFPFQGKRRD